MQEPDASLADEAEETIAEENERKRAYLFQSGIAVPTDQMYLVSLLEFLCGDDLAEAKDSHEHRIAPILDKAVTNLGVMQERQESARARATLLDGV